MRHTSALRVLLVGLMCVAGLSMALAADMPTKVPQSQVSASAATAMKPEKTEAYRAYAKAHANYYTPTTPSSNDAVATCYPLAANYETGSCISSSKTQTSLILGNGYDSDRGWAVFDISSIPSGSTISNVELHAYCYAMYWPYYSWTQVMTVDPRTAPASDVYTDIDYNNGYYLYITSDPVVNAYNTYTLGAQACTDLAAKTADGWYAVGLHEVDGGTTFYARFQGWAEANPPYIVVTYTAPSGADVGVDAIVHPSDGDLWLASGVPVTAIVHNFSTGAQTFDVTATDGTWSSTVTVTGLAAGATQLVDFGTWTGTEGWVDLSVTTLLGGDLNPANDQLVKSSWVAPVSDESIIYDDGTMTNAWYFYAYDARIAKSFAPIEYPSVVDHVEMYLLGPHSLYWVWPDATMDSALLSFYVDADEDGLPDEPAIFTKTVTADTAGPNDWYYVNLPVGAIQVQSGKWWVAFSNLAGGGEEGCGMDAASNFVAEDWWKLNGVWTNSDYYTGDDMFRSYYTPQVYATDLAVQSIVSPVGMGFPGIYTPSIIVKNKGTTPTVATPGGAAFDIPSLSYAELADVPALAPDEEVTLTFADVDLSGGGAYPLTATVTYTGDENPANNVKNGTAMIVDYFEDFDVTDGGYTNSGTGTTWQWGAPVALTSYSDPNCWGTNLSSGMYGSNANCYLNAVDFVVTQDNPYFLFYGWCNSEGYWDGWNLQYRIDGGAWTIATTDRAYDGVPYGVPGENCWWGVWDWTQITAQIPATAGSNVQIRWHFGSDGSVQYVGAYVDDVAAIGMRGPVKDVAVTQILNPPTTVTPLSTHPVQVTVQNLGDLPVAFNVYAYIAGSLGDNSSHMVAVPALAPGATADVDLAPQWFAVGGTYTMRCSAVLAGDQDLTNNLQTRTIQAGGTPPPPGGGWSFVENVPGATLIKYGAWLANDGEKTYVAKGNKSFEVYVYDADSFAPIAPLPAGTKPPKKGAKGIAAGVSMLYHVRGSNTQDFFSFDGTAWVAETPVPLGPTNKKVKGGDDMVYVDMVDSGFVYLLKGYKNEFWKYNTLQKTWVQLPNAPAEKWKEGSWLVYNDGFIYAHQAKEHGFYKFDVATDMWSPTPLVGMPIPSGLTGKNKKSKDGGSAALLDGVIYALKGGNTQEFWSYTIGDTVTPGTWTELDTIPAVAPGTTKKKKVKVGGDIALHGDVLYAIKANKTNDFWMYSFATPMYTERSNRDGAMAGVTPTVHSLAISPNPLSTGYATVRYSVPKAGAVSLNVFDVTGRTVVTRTLSASRTGAVSLDLRSLSAGVYLVKLSGDGFSTSQKLVVER